MKRLVLILLILVHVGAVLGTGGSKHLSRWPKTKRYTNTPNHNTGSRAERRDLAHHLEHRQTRDRPLQQKELTCRRIIVGTLIFGVVFARTYLVWQDSQNAVGK